MKLTTAAIFSLFIVVSSSGYAQLDDWGLGASSAASAFGPATIIYASPLNLFDPSLFCLPIGVEFSVSRMNSVYIEGAFKPAAIPNAFWPQRENYEAFRGRVLLKLRSQKSLVSKWYWGPEVYFKYGTFELEFQNDLGGRTRIGLEQIVGDIHFIFGQQALREPRFVGDWFFGFGLRYYQENYPPDNGFFQQNFFSLRDFASGQRQFFMPTFHLNLRLGRLMNKI